MYIYTYTTTVMYVFARSSAAAAAGIKTRSGGVAVAATPAVVYPAAGRLLPPALEPAAAARQGETSNQDALFQ